jgi:serine/threonine protein kinase
MSDSYKTPSFVAPASSDLAPLFPNYEMQGLIASGGMGAVYCALQKSLDRTVALKILPVEFSKDAVFCAGFEAEAKAMARLNHPNLVGVFEFGEVNGMLYIIMEFVPGKSIYHSAHGIAIEQTRVLQLVTSICSGLAHAHQNGIIHRDIKPSNILLDLNAQPKIGDFGLARPVERKDREGEDIFGTPHYTAPEVVNTPHLVDHRADIFSVGVMLHELLTGKLPAEDPRPASIIARCDSRFDSIIRRATQPLPSARYASVAEMGKDLEAITTALAQKSTKGAALPKSVRPVLARTIVKRKSSSSPTVLLMLAAAALVGGYFYFKPKAQVPTPIAEPTPTVVVKSLPVEELPKPPPVDKEEEQSAPVDEAPETTTSDEDSDTSSAENSTTTEPKSDVPAFFARARKIMQDRTKLLVTGYRGSLKFNCGEFERLAGGQMRKSKIATAAQIKAVVATLTEWKAAGGTIPDSVGEAITVIPSLDDIVEVARKRQANIEDTFKQNIIPHSAVYILGLEKEIQRLKAKADPGAIRLIQEEIAKTKKSPSYFLDLILGNSTAAEDE